MRATSPDAGRGQAPGFSRGARAARTPPHAPAAGGLGRPAGRRELHQVRGEPMSAVPSELSRFPKIELKVEPWPTERPLLALNRAIAAILWIVSIVTIVGMVYGIAIGIFLFVLHLGFVAHL